MNKICFKTAGYPCIIMRQQYIVSNFIVHVNLDTSLYSKYVNMYVRPTLFKVYKTNFHIDNESCLGSKRFIDLGKEKFQE